MTPIHAQPPTGTGKYLAGIIIATPGKTTLMLRPTTFDTEPEAIDEANTERTTHQLSSVFDASPSGKAPPQYIAVVYRHNHTTNTAVLVYRNPPEQETR